RGPRRARGAQSRARVLTAAGHHRRRGAHRGSDLRRTPHRRTRVGAVPEGLQASAVVVPRRGERKNVSGAASEFSFGIRRFGYPSPQVEIPMSASLPRPDSRSVVLLLISLAAILGAVPRALALDRSGFERQHRDDPKTLYIWAGDQARQAPDFLAVIDFDENSRDYGKVLRTVPIPPPGNIGNEPHHCHLVNNEKILACGGLLSLLRGQNSIFFFDVSNARHPRFLRSTNAYLSSVTDDFLPLDGGGFL